jgi:hypothetical protein
MSTEHHNDGPRRRRRSKAQAQGSTAMKLVMQGWEGLTDEERLRWDAQGHPRRMKGVNCFKQVNLRRLRRGEELIRLPRLAGTIDGRPLVRRLDIRNRAGRLTLELELTRKPDAPRTVWGSLPSNRGRRNAHKCPRLGWLPPAHGRWCDLTALYFAKHGQDIKRMGLELPGKRIFIRVRLELDEGRPLYEEVKAVVPTPELEMSSKALIPSKALRKPFEDPSKALRNIRPPSRRLQAPARRRKS